MAANIFQNGGVDNNWNTAGNWSLGVVPTYSDGNVTTFDATSPNCTINVTSDCNILLFENGFTATVTHSNQLTVGGDITYGGTGTITSTSILNLSTSCNIDTSTVAWSSVRFNGTSQTFTLLSDINCIAITFNGTTSTVVNGLFNINCAGGLSRATSVNVFGTATIVLTGTGIWSDAFSIKTFSSPLIINTSGTITFSGTIGKSGGLYYVAGTTNTAGSTLILTATCILDVNGDTSPSATTTSTTGINFNNLTTIYNGSHTANNIRVCGTHIAGGGRFNYFTTIYNKGNYTVNSNTGTGGYNYIMDGTGTWSGTQGVRHNFQINTTGTITISGTVLFNGGLNTTFTHIAGTVITTGSIVRIGTLGVANKIDASGIMFNEIVCDVFTTTTLLSDLNCNIFRATASYTFAGTGGVNCDNFISTNNTLKPKNGTTWNVYQYMYMSNCNFQSSVGTLKAYFNVNPAATMNNTNNTVTDIDSSGGQTVISPLSTFLRTINWSLTPNLGNMLLMF
jgi:hypothetical protein